jgi:hypothetical protein
VGRRQLIFAALWTEICLAYPVIHSLADGYDVFSSRMRRAGRAGKTRIP